MFSVHTSQLSQNVFELCDIWSVVFHRLKGHRYKIPFLLEWLVLSREETKAVSPHWHFKSCTWELQMRIFITYPKSEAEFPRVREGSCFLSPSPGLIRFLQTWASPFFLPTRTPETPPCHACSVFCCWVLSSSSSSPFALGTSVMRLRWTPVMNSSPARLVRSHTSSVRVVECLWIWFFWLLKSILDRKRDVLPVGGLLATSCGWDILISKDGFCRKHDIWLGKVKLS